MLEPNIRTIRAKKREALSEAQTLEERAAKKRAEASEYEAAERVWARLFGADDDSPDGVVETLNQMTEADLRVIGVGGGVELRRKPSGVPPVPEMILESLRLAQAQGKPGLTPQAMVGFVRTKYWPEASNPDIGSTAWRMWKDGRLAKPDENSSIYVIAGEIHSKSSPEGETGAVGAPVHQDSHT
jgi:hypothetical protein